MRFLRKSDSPSVFAAVEESRKELKRFLEWAYVTQSVQDVENFIKRCQVGRRKGVDFTFGVFERGSNSYLGNCALKLNEQKTAGEIGYWTRTSAARNGITTESCVLVLSFGFEELKLHKIILRAAPENRASNRVAEKLFFQYEGRQRDELKLPRKWLDMNMYSLLSSEYRRHKAALARYEY